MTEPVVPVQQETAQPASLADALAARGFETTSRIGATAWKGRHQGRECAVTVSRQSRTKYAGEVRYRKHLGWRLRIEMETIVRTRLFFVKESVTSNRFIRWIYRWRKQAVVEWVPPELEGFRAVAVDEAYAERFLAQRDATSHVGHLLRDGVTGNLQGSVYFMPESVYYGSPTLAGTQITTERVLGTLHRLDNIARAAESIQPPTVVSRLSRFEVFSKERPMATALLILGGCVGAMAFLGLLVIVGIWLVAYALGGPP